MVIMTYANVAAILAAKLPLTERLYELNLHQQVLGQHSKLIGEQILEVNNALIEAFIELQSSATTVVDNSPPAPDEQPPNGSPFVLAPTHDHKEYTRGDCNWVIEDGKAYTAMDGTRSDDHLLEGDDLIGQIWHFVNDENIEAGHSTERLIIGVEDNGGAVHMCYGYNTNDTRVIAGKDIKLHIVGLSEDAEFTINGLSDKYGFIAEFGTYWIGVRGLNSDSFIIRQIGPVGRLTRIGCWWLAYQDGHVHTSGASLSHGFESMVWSFEQWKGIALKEHLIYFKPGGALHILYNNLFGGNRSGFQRRSHPSYHDKGSAQPETAAPTDIFVIANNHCEGHGTNHVNASGGAVITVWSNPFHDTWIMNNHIVDSRYSGIVISDQSEGRNWLNDKGFPVSRVYMSGNTVTGSDRQDFMVSGCEKLILGTNAFDKVVVNSDWSAQYGAGIKVGEIVGHFNTEAAVKTWDASLSEYVPYEAGTV